MDKTKKIKQILETVKINVEDISSFEQDIDSILNIFNDISAVDTTNISSELNKRKVSLNDLREDISIDAKFKQGIKGNYFKVPNVSKKAI